MHIRDIKIEAKERFALNRYQAMLVYGVVYTLALNIAVLTTVLFLINKWAAWYGVILIFLFLLLLAPFNYGMTGFYLRLYRFEKIDAFHVFDGFNKYNLERMIVLRLLSFVLWLAFTVLLIVPGIIFLVRTSMATYLLRADPEMKPQDALRAANKIMKSHCWKFFGLSLSFTGWFLMGMVTCGLGFIWVLPYYNAAKIVFYKRELQGDKTVYRNPTEIDDASALSHTKRVNPENEEAVSQSGTSTSAVQTERPGITVPASDPTNDVTVNSTLAENAVVAADAAPAESVRQNDSTATVADISPEQEQTRRAETSSERTQGVPGLQRTERRPLSGNQVIMDESGRRTVNRLMTGDALPEEKQYRRIEIGENEEIKTEESVRERIERLRAQRAARRTAVVSARRDVRASEKNTEIGEE